MRKDGFVVVQPWMVQDYGLNGNKLLIYALIYGFSQDEQSCFYGSTSYIMDCFHLSKNTVLDVLGSLETSGLIRKWSEPVNGRTTNRYAALRPAAFSTENDGCKKCTSAETAPVQKVCSDGCRNCTQTSAETAPKKENNNKANNKHHASTWTPPNRFHPPLIEDVKAHFAEKGGTATQAERFFAYYESNGWRVGRNPMKNWKAAASGWLSRDKDAGPKNQIVEKQWEDL